jgi:translation initiation factor 3 subunit L
MAENADFSLPNVIKDFIFDIHDAMRRSKRDEDVNVLYEVKFKEITEKYFGQSAWPNVESVAKEANYDEGFLLFYKEMTFRHITTKLKPQLADHISSWANYVKLFEFVLSASDDEFCITSKWIYDITQEFAYQFQGFCQLRCQNANHNAETTRILEANRDAWNFPTVVSILKKLMASSKAKANGKTNITPSSPFSVQFGYFATIELARLECLLGDFSSSLSAISSISLNDRSELFMQLPVCHLNVFYHTGVCNMMLRKFYEASDVFNELILYVSRILKPGAAANLRQGVAPQLQRMLDKVLALTAIVITLFPSNRIDDQCLELVEGKWSDKFRKLQSGEKSAFVELFDFASPKYISPIVPNYSVHVNMHQAASHHMLDCFITEVQQHISFLKLRSYSRERSPPLWSCSILLRPSTSHLSCPITVYT